MDDGIPLIEEMLEDKNVSLREHAASALLKLTGKKPEINQPSLSFPKTDLKEGLIEKIGLIGKEPQRTFLVSFSSWLEKVPGLVLSTTDELRLYGEDLKQFELLRTDLPVQSYIIAPNPGGETQIVALVSDKDKFFSMQAAYAAAFNLKGEVLWKHRTEYSGIKTLSPLYGGKGETVGIVFGHGGEDGIIITDLAGTKIAQAPKYHVLYSIKTHPAFPNTFVTCGGNIDVFNEKGNKISGGTGKKEYTYFHEIEIFPSKDGELSIIATGSAENQKSVIVRLDKNLNRIWSATLPVGISNLTMVEPSDVRKPRLFVAVTRTGELFTFDEDGTLLHQMNMDQYSNGKAFFYGMESGLLSNETYAFSLVTLEGVIVFRFKF